MQDIKKDPFEEYIKNLPPTRKELGQAWSAAIGLQDVDGLKPSEYLYETARKNIDGEITVDEAGDLINSYYESKIERVEKDSRTEEADKVSARIAKILSEKAFTFSPTQYLAIHKELFHGIYSYAGKIRDYNITKKEWVLAGDTVSYANAITLKETLDYDFSQERNFKYNGLTMDETIQHLAAFISGLWQIHVFGEGNTRTTAVFFIKYLRMLGFDVENDLFAENSWYFRNALVRANYNDIVNGVYETTEYLELFLRNLLLGEHNELRNRYIHARWKNTEQDIGGAKQDIRAKKQDIQIKERDIYIPNELSSKTKQHISELFLEFGYDRFFGRTDVQSVLGITASPTSALLKKMLESDLIYPIKGKGKGKYLFKKMTKE